MRGYRRRRRLTRGALVLLGLLALALAVTAWVQGSLRPLMQATARMQAQAAALDLINRVVVAKVGAVTYADLVRIRTDDQGRITLLQTDTAAAGRIAAIAVAAMQQELEQLGEQRFTVPLGQVLGNWFLAHRGPGLPVVFRPLGAATVAIRQRFEEAGINQTRHQLALDIRVRMQVVLPLVSEEVAVADEFPIAEAIVVGDVPDTYWRGDLGGWRPAPAAPGKPLKRE